MALITDGEFTFANLIYLNPDIWKWNDKALMGLNSGVHSDIPPLSYLMIPPQGSSVWSNIGVPGEWLFRVDTAAALQPQRMCILVYSFPPSPQILMLLYKG